MQVLLGLQSNALKFTQGGEVNIRVRISNQFLEIEVRDTGIGISEENQEKLFKLFGFLEGSKEQNKNGIGLGLAISKQIVEQYEGEISLKSKVGEGSSFTFKFKISDESSYNT
jgi:signal transduction histidine kinase